MGKFQPNHQQSILVEYEGFPIDEEKQSRKCCLSSIIDIVSGHCMIEITYLNVYVILEMVSVIAL